MSDKKAKAMCVPCDDQGLLSLAKERRSGRPVCKECATLIDYGALSLPGNASSSEVA